MRLWSRRIGILEQMRRWRAKLLIYGMKLRDANLSDALAAGREAWRLPFFFTKEGIDWTHETGKNVLFPVCRLLLLKS